MKKTYIIDTNVLVHDYNSFDLILGGNKVIIPYQVLRELDGLKSKTSNVGVNARHVIRQIEKEIINKNPDFVIDLEEHDTRLEPDDRILETCKTFKSSKPTLISKDVCLRTKARALGINTEDYREDRVQISNLYSGVADTEYVPTEVIDEVYEKKVYPTSKTYFPNQAVILADETNPKNKCITTYKNGVLTAIDNKIAPFGLKPANLEQTIAANLLLDKDVSLVTLTGGAGCYPKGTEFFSRTGWKPIEEYVEGEEVLQVDKDTLNASFVVPQEYIKKPVDTFYNIKNKRVNFTTSKEHKHLTYNQKTKRLEEILTKDLVDTHNRNATGNNKKLITNFQYSGSGMPYTNDELRLRVAIIAEGHITDSLRVQMSFKKERKITRFRELLEKTNTEYTEGVVSGYTRFWFKVPKYEKEFALEWYNASFEQMKVIADEVLLWDGSIIDRSKNGRIPSIGFFSTSKKSTDYVQFIFTVVGYNPAISYDVREGRKTTYRVGVNQSQGVGIAKNPRAATTTTITEVESEDGLMYCFCVDSGFFVVRQHDQIYVSGNSGKTLLAVACALEAVLERKEYSKITIARPIMPFQQDIGYLP